MTSLLQLLTTIVGLLSPESSLGPQAEKCCTTEVLGPACDVEIYCYGQILDKVQMCSIFPDSKTFVDMKMINSPDITKAEFQKIMDANAGDPTCEQIGEFVKANFEGPDLEFEKWTPADWKEEPKVVDLIQDGGYKKWALALNAIWKDLGRQIITDVHDHPELYSLIYVENPVIVPGGRFREFYYWDSYWIIQGLLQSEMFDTVKGMLYNFKSMIDRYGFIPNGGRVYYTKRSQPPLYAMMCDAYYEATGDQDFAKEIVPTLEQEFQFWVQNHTVTVEGHEFFVYGDKSTGPRPESYREDMVTASSYKTDAEKEECMSELKAAAESGMDFSSRWFINSEGTNIGNLTNLKTRHVVPVDLNAYLYRSARIISKFLNINKKLTEAVAYDKKADSISEAIQAVLWDPEVGIWLDYDMINEKRRNYFIPSNLAPLWVQCYDADSSVDLSKSVMNYLTETTKVTSYPGGIPNSLYNTGEQWDFPNIWPPMVYLIVVGLENLGTPEATELAYNLVNTWVSSNYAAYLDASAMFEKYNAEKYAGHGSGGEYGVQLGFGWTNGVILHFLAKYGDTIKPLD